MKAPVQLSFSGKIWRNRPDITQKYYDLSERYGLDAIFASILADRGLDSLEKVEQFFQPRLTHLVEPLQLRDMDRATERIIKALHLGEKVAIFGDYDVDGATSTAMLVRYFRALGVEASFYIPDRLSEGYGPNVKAMETLAAAGHKVVITVDCGIAAFAALEAAKQAGMDVIVTDHHVAIADLPLAYAVINPNRQDESFPHKELAGVGVAFYLLMALNRGLRQQGYFNSQRPEPDLKQFLDLVAVGTIADVASLTGLNRPLVAAGLRVAERAENLGIKALMQSARLRFRLSAGQVGFQLGPRINAGGRLGKGALGAELLSTEDQHRAVEIAALLEHNNRERQTLEMGILKQAMQQLTADPEHLSRFGLVLADHNWHPGVVGIVASRIVDRMHRPTVVIAVDAEGKGKGSARSIPGVDLLSAIQAGEAFLTRFGGHQSAAGLSIDADQIAPFAQAFDAYLQKHYPQELFQPALTLDGELTIRDSTRELVSCIERLQPFGRGNPEPVFVFHNLLLVSTRTLKEHHVKCYFADSQNNALEAIAFRALPGDLGVGLLAAHERLDVAGTLAVNEYQNRETVQLIIRDARRAL